GNAPAGVIMRDPWTRCGLVFRLLQAAFAAAALAVMASTDDFPSVTTFRCLPRSSSKCAMPVEPRRGHSGCLCNCCQTFLPNWPGCHHTCPRGLGHRYTHLQCSVWISSYHHSPFQ
uniref:CASP-like protein n=1 Tax=Aegilops tauschii subsp. strangulata TaxID=200361 RepID=A0A453DFG0_AEGTS